MSASRRAFWVRSGLLGLAVFALLAFTLHSLRLSDASFAAASANTSNVFIAGTLGHVNNQNGRVHDQRERHGARLQRGRDR